jgi:hypothetical protein
MNLSVVIAYPCQIVFNMPNRYLKIISTLVFTLPFFAQAQQSSPQVTRIQPVEFIDHRVSASQLKKDATLEESTKSKVVQGSELARDENLMNNSFVTSSGLYWLNIYNSKRNSFILDDGFINNNERSELTNLANQGIANAENTFEANYIKLRESRNSDQAYRFLRRANELSPNNTYLYVENAWQAERYGNSTLVKSNINAAYNSNQISAFLTKISSFILQEAQPNAIIITNGENDTYPFWYLSNNKNITVISLAMLEDVAYINKKLKNANSSVSFRKIPGEKEFIRALLNSSKAVYLSWGIRPDILEAFKTKLYSVGPMLQLSNTSIENIDMLKKFYLNNEIYNYLLGDSWSSDKYARFATNLFPGLKTLINSYTVSDSELRRLKNLETAIGNKTSKSLNNDR